MSASQDSTWTVTEEYEVSLEIMELEGDSQIVRYVRSGWQAEGKLSASHPLIRGRITVQSEGMGETPGEAMTQACEGLRAAWEARIGRPWNWV